MGSMEIIRNPQTLDAFTAHVQEEIAREKALLNDPALQAEAREKVQQALSRRQETFIGREPFDHSVKVNFEDRRVGDVYQRIKSTPSVPSASLASHKVTKTDSSI